MATKTKTEQALPGGSWLNYAIIGQQRNALILLAVVAVLSYAAYEAWSHWGASRVHWEKYTLGWDEIQVTPPPPWVRSDVKGDVARRIDSSRLALRDREVTRQVAQSYALHPWVEKVQRVQKVFPAKMHVQLAYRRPVAMVEVEHQGRAGLLPVDRFGVLLPPDDFTTGDAKSLPRIRVADTFPAAGVGLAWGDERVVGAAGIAETLLDKWSSSPLFCIVAQPLAPGGMPEAVGFELHTRGERKLIWGRAPGREISGEIPAEMKLPKLWDALRSPGNQMVDLTRAF